ncbi:hypothetical protein ACG04R_16440 [Roseateles sp. BYS78W]|uniref:Uncharacterized protein n=1 Tax=Pelomonas candidula TaxID=3299025 RepID=A0ABW7HEN2_9BURK
MKERTRNLLSLFKSKIFLRPKEAVEVAESGRPTYSAEDLECLMAPGRAIVISSFSLLASLDALLATDESVIGRKVKGDDVELIWCRELNTLVRDAAVQASVTWGVPSTPKSVETCPVLHLVLQCINQTGIVDSNGSLPSATTCDGKYEAAVSVLVDALKAVEPDRIFVVDLMGGWDPELLASIKAQAQSQKDIGSGASDEDFRIDLSDIQCGQRFMFGGIHDDLLVHSLHASLDALFSFDETVIGREIRGADVELGWCCQLNSLVRDAAVQAEVNWAFSSTPQSIETCPVVNRVRQCINEAGIVDSNGSLPSATAGDGKYEAAVSALADAFRAVRHQGTGKSYSVLF